MNKSSDSIDLLERWEQMTTISVGLTSAFHCITSRCSKSSTSNAYSSRKRWRAGGEEEERRRRRRRWRQRNAEERERARHLFHMYHASMIFRTDDVYSSEKWQKMGLALLFPFHYLMVVKPVGQKKGQTYSKFDRICARPLTETVDLWVHDGGDCLPRIANDRLRCGERNLGVRGSQAGRSYRISVTLLSECFSHCLR